MAGLPPHTGHEFLIQFTDPADAKRKFLQTEQAVLQSHRIIASLSQVIRTSIHISPCCGGGQFTKRGLGSLNLAGQNFPRTCQKRLEEFGHFLHEPSYDPSTGLSDDWLFAEAQKQTAIFLTTDQDFFHTVPWLQPIHAGAIASTLARPNRDQK